MMGLTKKKKNKRGVAGEVVGPSLKKTKESSPNTITNDLDELECPSPVAPPNPFVDISAYFDYPEEDYSEECRRQSLRYASKSLEHYNKEKGTNYELVEAFKYSNAIYKPDGLAVHCNFEAKSTNQNDGSSTELFFGELLYDSCTTNLEVIYCDILKGNSHGCKECGIIGGLKHPPSGYLLPSYDVPFIKSDSVAAMPIASEVETEKTSPLRNTITNGFDELECPPSPVSSPTPYYDEISAIYDYPEEDISEDCHHQSLKCASKSLEHYNKEKGTNYELVEALNSNAIYKRDGLTLHCNFEAKLTNQNGGSSTELFFGELLYDSCTTNLEVIYCDILKGNSHGCKECGIFGGLEHPPPQYLLPSYVLPFIKRDSVAAMPIASEVETEKTSPLRDTITNGLDELECPPPVSSPTPYYDFVSGIYDYPEEDISEDCHHQSLKCASKSLEHYNKEKGTNYELVEALNSNAIYKRDGLALHCNFEAKSTNQNGGSSTELFFGELLYDSCTTNLEVIYCDILKGKSHRCKECGILGGLKHPPKGFLLPSYGDVPFTIRTRSRDVMLQKLSFH